MSSATLTLRRAIWIESARKSFVNNALSTTGDELESELREEIDKSTPSGRLYRIGSLTTRRTRATRNLPSAPGRRSRVISGSVIHRASAEGQPPAKRTHRLYRLIRVRRIGNNGLRAEVRVPYARYLDNPNQLNRPFFRHVVRRFFRTRFQPRFREELRKLL